MHDMNLTIIYICAVTEGIRDHVANNHVYKFLKLILNNKWLREVGYFYKRENKVL